MIALKAAGASGSKSRETLCVPTTFYAEMTVHLCEAIRRTRTARDTGAVRERLSDTAQFLASPPRHSIAHAHALASPHLSTSQASFKHSLRINYHNTGSQVLNHQFDG